MGDGIARRPAISLDPLPTGRSSASRLAGAPDLLSVMESMRFGIFMVRRTGFVDYAGLGFAQGADYYTFVEESVFVWQPRCFYCVPEQARYGLVFISNIYTIARTRLRRN